MNYKSLNKWQIGPIIYDRELLAEDLARHWETEPRKGNKIQLFDSIWEGRGETDSYMVTVNVSEISGKILYPKSHKLWHFQFLHVLSVGSHKSLEFWPQNIMMGTSEEHHNQEQYEVFTDRAKLLKSVYNEVVKEYGGKPPRSK